MILLLKMLRILFSEAAIDVSSVDEGELHMKKWYPSVIRFYNFRRSNKSAPIEVKTKVLSACLSSLLHSSAMRDETLGVICGEIGDKAHTIYSCFSTLRDDLRNFDGISALW